MVKAEAQKKVEDILFFNRGHHVLTQLFTNAILAAFEEGALAERERQDAMLHEGRMAGRGG